VQKLRNFTFYIIEDTTAWPARVFNIAMILLIMVSTTSWLLETNKEFAASYGGTLAKIEYFCMLAFICEYAMRFLAHGAPQWKFFFKPMSLVDALAILPFFFAGSSDTAALRLLRLFRVFRLFKLARYSEAVARLGTVFHQNASVFGVFIFMIAVILLIAASLMHALEPVRFAQMTDALWWSIVTLTTVGYGDIVPETLIGRAIAAVLMIFGIGIIALPTGVLGASMTRLMADEKNTAEKSCGRCGETKHLAESRFCHRCGEKFEA